MNLLNDLTAGQHATICGINAIQAEQPLYQRLMALGFRIGKPVQVIRKGNFRGPLHIRVGSTDIIMRESEAKLIQIAH